MIGMDDDNDSDKENKDPAVTKAAQPTPPSKKRLYKRRRERQTSPFVHSVQPYPVNLSEDSFVFMKRSNVWVPGRIMQVTSHYNIVCYWFTDNSISNVSRNKLSSFLNYGTKVDFDLLDSDTYYRKGILDCLTGFAELHRPDLLQLNDAEIMLLDWARLGFIGCKLTQRSGPCIKTEYNDDEVPSSSRTSEDCLTPLCGQLAESPRSSRPSPKKRKFSLQTEDSGYSSPDRIKCLLSSPLSECALSTQSSLASEVDTFVLGKLTRYGWWPGRIADPRKSPRWCKQSQRLIYWFGDCTRSLVDVKDIVPITMFPAVYQKSKKGLYRVALYDFLSDAAMAVNFTEVHAPESVNIDEAALERLVAWACDGFKPTGPPTKWEATDSYHSPAPNCSSTSVNKSSSARVEGYCVGCVENKSSHPHPLFKETLCGACFEDFSQCAFVFGEDGTGNYCSICNHGGNLFICDQSQCGRGYCHDCVKRVCGAEALFMVEWAEPWLCLLCCEPGILGRLERRDDWQARLQGLLTRQLEGESQYAIPAPPPIPQVSERKPIRVLSLFDGIATGLVALKNIGFQLGAYVSSEVDDDGVKVSKVHHPEVVHVGDVQNLGPQQIAELGPFDLVIGGSPCNDLSTVNPARKGIYEGTGRLFFEYYRILNYVIQQSKGAPVFWLFENVVSMTHADKKIITRFLQNNPVVIDAKHVSCMNRARYFWGNLPGMNRAIVALETDRLSLQECLEKNCDRVARFEKINCITTKMTSIKQTKDRTFPVKIAGDPLGPGDWLWCTEIERVFGLEPHYTDVANLSRQGRQRLLGKAWSVPALRHLFSPLRDYFKCKRD